MVAQSVILLDKDGALTRLVEEARRAHVRAWDPAMAGLVEAFVRTAEVGPKLELWERIVDRVVEPMGGQTPVEESSCRCAVCREDLALLSAAAIAPEVITAKGTKQ